MRFKLLAILAALVAAAPAFAQVLTLEEAIRLGELHSPRLAAQRHALAAAAEQIGRAAELPDPKLRLGLENLPVTGAERYRYDRDFMTMRSVGLMQEFPSRDKRRARNLRAEAMHSLEQANNVLQRAAVRREVAQAWFEVHFADKARVALERLARQFKLQIDAVAAGVARGRQGAAESYVLRQAYEQTNDRVIEQQRLLARARIQLGTWLADAAQRPLAAPPEALRIPPPADQVLHRLGEHPVLRMLEQREGLARSEVELARTGRKSDWSLEVSFAQREPAFDNMVSVMVSMDLPWQAGRRQDRDIASRLAEAEQVSAQREEARRIQLAELQGWRADFDAAQSRIERFEKLLLPLARERAAVARAAYQGGRGELGGVLEAERSFTEAETGLAQAELERARAWAALSFAYPQGEGQ